MGSLQLIENRIAEAMAQVTTEPAGLTPDNAAEEIAASAHINGLTADHVRRGQTPSAIATQWLQSRLEGTSSTGQATPENRDGRFALLPYSQVVYDSMKQGNAEAWTFALTLQTEAERVDAQQLRNAMETALDAHPIFRTHIDEQGQQYYDASQRTPYFQYDIQTDSAHVSLSIQANRILGDGSSFLLLLSDLDRAYHGLPIPTDPYYRYLRQHEAHRGSHEYRQHAETLHAEFDGMECLTHPLPDMPFGTDAIQANLNIDLSDLANAIRKLQEREKSSLNVIVTLASALAIMDYNHTDEAALTWAYAGRENTAEQHIFGSLHRDIPVRVSRSSSDSPHRLLQTIKEDMRRGVTCSDHPYTFLATDRTRWQQAVNVLLQPRLTPHFCDADWCLLPHSSIPSPQPANCLFDIEIGESPLCLTLRYASPCYSDASIQRFATLHRRNLEWLLDKRS